MKHFKSVVVTIANATNTKGLRYIAKSDLANNYVSNNVYSLNQAGNCHYAVQCHLDIVNAEKHNVDNGFFWEVLAGSCLPNSNDMVFIITAEK